MTLDLGRQSQEIGGRQAFPGERIAGHEAADRRRRRRPQTARQRDRVAHLDAPADALRDLAPRQLERGLETAHEPVLPAVRELVRALAVDRQLDRPTAPAADLDLDPVHEVERDTEAVVPGAEVRGRARDVHGDPCPVQLREPVRHHPSARATSASVGSASSSSTRDSRSAVAGSLSPFPVRTHTTTASGSSSFCRAARDPPATLAADDGSQKTPSSLATSAYAARISASLTASIRPPDSSRAAIAFSHDAGLPIRIAVAIVSGCSTGRPVTSGAAPSAWKPHMRGAAAISPAST